MSSSSIKLHWFLPTNGDSRTDLSLGNAVGAHGSRIEDRNDSARPGDIGYMSQIARSAEQLGFEAALTPTSSWCEDAWVITAALTQLTRSFKFLVAFRPGLRVADAGGADGRDLPARLRRAAAAERRGRRRRGRAAPLRRLDRQGRALRARRRVPGDRPRAVGRGGGRLRRASTTGSRARACSTRRPGPTSTSAAPRRRRSRSPPRHADVFLTWGEPPAQVAEKLDASASRAAERAGRELRFGIRLHVIARDTADEAWAEAERLLAGLGPEKIAAAQAIQRALRVRGPAADDRAARRHAPTRSRSRPTSGPAIGLVRGGAGTALVGSHEEVADRIAEYHELGIDEFILSGYPHLEEAYRVGEGLIPVLRDRGLLASPATPVPA